MVFPDKVRIDSGYIEGDTVSIYYDSLLAKIISKGKDREEAISKITEALEKINIDGIQTNLDFLIDILSTNEFKLSKIDTNFISKQYKGGYKGIEKNEMY